MKIKAVIPRALAKRDVDEAIAWYLNENAVQAALGLIDALEQASRTLHDILPRVQRVTRWS